MIIINIIGASNDETSIPLVSLEQKNVLKP